MVLFKYCMVLDLDENLIHVDFENIFVRPYVETALQIMRRQNSFITILWTQGTKNYAYNILSRLNWFHLFDKILTRDGCEFSFKLYNEYKSSFYIKKIVTNELSNCTQNIKYIFIDDLAFKNEIKNLYDSKINIIPFQKLGPDVSFHNAVKEFI